ncbi:MAG: hypothetical protein R6V72_22475 [Cyclobacterium sp.]|uniref:hypothetical protein n=1 Tax=unclassified Cyclobacterium TaxID=2615055 RepID=UPI0013D398C5|nr:hypothetical protein [Cyclobacterium sp. SYSU L10401]
MACTILANYFACLGLYGMVSLVTLPIAMLTVSFQSIKTALMNLENSLRSEGIFYENNW